MRKSYGLGSLAPYFFYLPCSSPLHRHLTVAWAETSRARVAVAERRWLGSEMAWDTVTSSSCFPPPAHGQCGSSFACGGVGETRVGAVQCPCVSVNSRGVSGTRDVGVDVTWHAAAGSRLRRAVDMERRSGAVDVKHHAAPS